MEAFILAGGTIPADMIYATGVGKKALLPLSGKPLLEYPLSSLCMVPEIERVGVVIDESLMPPELAGMADWTAPEGTNIIKSIASGMSKVESEMPVLIAACDLPLLSNKMVEEFIEAARARNLEMAYSYVSEKDSESKFPGFSHTYVNLKEGRCCGGGLFLFSKSAFNKIGDLVHRLMEARKSPMKMAGIIGFKTLMKLLFGGLNIAALENWASDLIGAKAGAIQSPYAEVAFNIDKLEQYEYARNVMEKL
ncbi:MAG: nucleotidyltransferase family protein [Chloroflexi bacterium]|nr:nucleotidyltransferase family protein [Chloroflexota bacterium]